MIKKILCFMAFCLVIALLCLAPQAKAMAAMDSGNEDVACPGPTTSVSMRGHGVNRLYARDGEALVVFDKPVAVKGGGMATRALYQTKEECSDALRRVLKSRAPSAIVALVVPEWDPDAVEALCQDIVDQAFAHTGIPTEGDYLLFHYRTWDVNASIAYATNGFRVTFAFTFTYLDNAEQEAVVDEAVKIFVAQNIRDGMSDYEKAAAIHSFIAKEVEYDYDHLNDDGYLLKHSAYAAMIDRKAVCQGIALLCYRLCLETGLDARCISGDGAGNRHAWNIVGIDGLYYNVDCTWDINYKEHQSWRWFLLGEDNFSNASPSHTRDDFYTSEAFMSAYPMDPGDYTPQIAPVIVGHSLVLNGMIGVNFYIDAKGNDMDGAYMSFSQNISHSDIPIADAELQASGLYRFSCFVNSVSMADPIFASFHYAEDKAVSEEYTVLAYLNTIVENKKGQFSDALIKLAKAIHNYGYYSQRIAGATAHTAMPAAYMDVPLVTSLQGNSISSTKSSNVSKVTCFLTLDAATKLGVYLTSSSEAMTAKVDGLSQNAYTFSQEADGRWLLTITGIEAPRLGERFHITAHTNGGDTTVDLSCLSYIEAVLSSNAFDHDVKAAVGALAAFYSAAVEYFAALSPA